MKKILICLNGSGGSGKDQFVKYCDKNNKDNIKVVNLSTIDIVRNAARMFGYNDIKTEKNRQFLVDLKQLVKRYNNHPRQYIEYTIKNMKGYEYSENVLIFVHTREIDEIKEFMEYFTNEGLVNKCFSLLITNINVPKIVSNESDKNVENFNYDYIIKNDFGLIELENHARLFINIMKDNFKELKGEV